MHGATTDADPSTPRPAVMPLVGVFDSGIGGLTVVAALRRLAPDLPLRYLGDTAWFPYGDRPEDEVRERALAITEMLVAAGCGLVVVACNTASSAALEHVRERCSIPIVGIEPPLKPAAARTRSGHVAVLATSGTARGARLARLAGVHAGDVRVETLPMPGLADRVERGEILGEELEALLRSDLAPILGSDVDQVALGCTHYGFLRPTLQRLVGLGVEIIDAAEPVAQRVIARLPEAAATDRADPPPSGGPVRMVVTGDRQQVEAAISRLRAEGADLPPIVIESTETPLAAASGRPAVSGTERITG